MSKTYTIVKGDTLFKIAQRFYGNGSKYPLIFDASNFRSGDPDLIYPGEVATIPDLPEDNEINNEVYKEITPPAPERIKNADKDEVFLMIDGKLFYGWEGIQITKNMDTCADGFSFTAAFDPDDTGLRELFRPFKYKNCRIYIGNKLILNGTIKKITASLDTGNNSVNVQGISLPGRLVTCSIDTYPLQFYNQTLKQISESVCAPFGIGVQADSDSDVFKKVTAENGQGAFDFLDQVAKKRGLLLSSTYDGKLLIQQANVNAVPVAELEPGISPLYPLSVEYDGEKRFSKITAIGQGRAKNNYRKTVNDDSILVYRPLVFSSSDNEAGNIGKAAETKRARSVMESFPFTIKIAGWRDRAGDLFKTNTIILLKCPEAMIYNYTRFLIAGLTFTITNDGDRQTEIRPVMPESYTLEFPEKFPWED